jgi:hypothetical protein
MYLKTCKICINSYGIVAIITVLSQQREQLVEVHAPYGVINVNECRSGIQILEL